METAIANGPRILHRIPGRVRVSLPGWSGVGAGEIEQRLRQVRGVQRAQANPLTRNVLILFDPRLTDAAALVEVLHTNGFPVNGRPEGTAEEQERSAQENGSGRSGALSRPDPSRWASGAGQLARGVIEVAALGAKHMIARRRNPPSLAGLGLAGDAIGLFFRRRAQTEEASLLLGAPTCLAACWAAAGLASRWLPRSCSSGWWNACPRGPGPPSSTGRERPLSRCSSAKLHESHAENSTLCLKLGKISSKLSCDSEDTLQRHPPGYLLEGRLIMPLENYAEPEVAVAAAVTAAAASPSIRKVLRRSLVYGLAGVLVAYDKAAEVAQGWRRVSVRGRHRHGASRSRSRPPSPFRPYLVSPSTLSIAPARRQRSWLVLIRVPTTPFPVSPLHLTRTLLTRMASAERRQFNRSRRQSTGRRSDERLGGSIPHPAGGGIGGPRRRDRRPLHLHLGAQAHAGGCSHPGRGSGPLGGSPEHPPRRPTLITLPAHPRRHW